MSPRYLTGDFVRRSSRPGNGIVISVRRANPDERMAEVYPYVYYILFSDGRRFEGPLYQSELQRV